MQYQQSLISGTEIDKKEVNQQNITVSEKQKITKKKKKKKYNYQG